MTVGVALGRLRAEDWSAAMALSARAFFREPFTTGIFGPDPVDRFEGMQRLYAAAHRQDGEVAIGAFAGDVLVGLVRAWPPGECDVCIHGGEGERPNDPAVALDWEFRAHVRRAHGLHGDHAWISQVAVEPSLEGNGIGRSLVAESVATLRRRGARLVLLECQDHRVAFYEAVGFTETGSVPDPTGPDARLMTWAS